MLSWFASDFFAKSPVLMAPLLAMAIFGSVFVFYALRALFLDKRAIRRLDQLPLADDAAITGGKQP